jgi:hypothetical protein
MGAKGKGPPAEVDETTMEDEDISTHQETIPIPLISGTRNLALRWLAPAYDMVSRQAPDSKPGKK